MPQRPLSPHVTIYAFRYSVVTSIVNRATGIVLSIGLLLLAYWLMALAGGAQEYARANALLSLGIFKLLYAGLFFSFSYHLVAGIRHLIWDTGHYMERAQSMRSAKVVVWASLLLTLLLLYLAFFSGSHSSGVPAP